MLPEDRNGDAQRLRRLLRRHAPGRDVDEPALNRPSPLRDGLHQRVERAVADVGPGGAGQLRGDPGGADALRDYRTRYAQAVAISNLLSAKQEEIVEAVEQLQSTLVEEKRAQNSLRRNILEEELKRLPDAPVAGNLAVFSPLLEARQLRELVNAGVTRCSGIFAAFAGSDESGYTYVMGSKTVDLRSSSKEINTALSGRGGGSEEMIQGSAGASEKEIRAYLEGEA